MGGPLEVVGTGIAGDPVAVSWGPGRLDIFARAANGDLLHKFFEGAWGPHGMGGPFEVVGAGVKGKVTAVASPSMFKGGILAVEQMPTPAEIQTPLAKGPYIGPPGFDRGILYDQALWQQSGELGSRQRFDQQANGCHQLNDAT